MFGIRDVHVCKRKRIGLYDAKKKVGPVESLSRKEKKANKRRTSKVRRQLK